MSQLEAKLNGVNLFGEPIRQTRPGPLAERFFCSPFSVLSAGGGYWMERKRAWLAMGIESEVGRAEDLCYKGISDDVWKKSNTSVFDPVLCECMYRWFCPEGGQVVDPFAGGSVRGIVAGMLGRRYWGCDLQQEQIDANNVQADDILGTTVSVKISAAMLRQEFHPCSMSFVHDVCKGRCCEGTGGIKVTIHRSEEAKIKAKGAEIRDGFIVPDRRGLCPFKLDDGLCSIHDDKPYGCRFSPFTLNGSDTLIVRNRYRLLRCYKCEEGKLPAYKAHRWSLDHVLGKAEAARVVAHLDAGGDDIFAEMPAHNYSIMCDNDAAKGSQVEASRRPVWVCGDSMDTLAGAPEADFVFSCPPYGDLEKYSDDPADLSTMKWDAFVVAYKRIIQQAVSRLKEDRFACFVVANFRDKKGIYRDFVGATIDAFRDCGAGFYNDAILATSLGTAAWRATRQFSAGRKLIKVHQNVLVFCKGDWHKAAAGCPPPEMEASGDGGATVEETPAAEEPTLW